MRTLAMIVLMTFAGCLNAGCYVPPPTAEQLYGARGAARGPQMSGSFKKSIFGETIKFETSSDFSGTGDVEVDPATKAFKLKVVVASNASNVLDKYPAWIASMEATTKAALATNVENNKVQGQKWHDGMATISDVMRTLGTAGIGIAEQIASTLAGSTMDVTTPWGVGVTGKLGTAPPPAPLVAAPIIAAPVGDTMTTTGITKAPPPGPPPTIIMNAAPTAPAAAPVSDGVITKIITTETKTEPTP